MHEALVRMGNVPADDQHIRIQQAHSCREHVPECPSGSGDDAYGVRISLPHQRDNVTRCRGQVTQSLKVPNHRSAAGDGR